MTDPRVICKVCGCNVMVTPDGRGFPPAIARRKLAKICKEHGCDRPNITYRAGVVVGGRPEGQ